jgi:hypothetical protein
MRVGQGEAGTYGPKRWQSIRTTGDCTAAGRRSAFRGTPRSRGKTCRTLPPPPPTRPQAMCLLSTDQRVSEDEPLCGFRVLGVLKTLLLDAVVRPQKSQGRRSEVDVKARADCWTDRV